MFGGALALPNKIQRGMARIGVVTYAVMLAARAPAIDDEEEDHKYILLPCALFLVCWLCTDFGHACAARIWCRIARMFMS